MADRNCALHVLSVEFSFKWMKGFALEIPFKGKESLKNFLQMEYKALVFTQ